ncbi:hypothetical protein IFM89_030698 [Coptis chinensis]|uniref:Uncharacterized protein n=1 Tax=Coptis chinensis TaxID=261450 RepID=A0A835IVQ9_9MAGN|nr:hypothetical protein IFM89_030698 [Coptis chinensis]
MPALRREGVGDGWKGFVYALEGVYDKKRALKKIKILKEHDDGNSLSNLLWWIHSRSEARNDSKIWQKFKAKVDPGRLQNPAKVRTKSAFCPRTRLDFEPPRAGHGKKRELVNWTLPALGREGVGEGWKGFVYALQGVYDKEGALEKIRNLNGHDDGNSLFEYVVVDS